MKLNWIYLLLIASLGTTLAAQGQDSDRWPELPTKDASVEIPAQEWPLRPGLRTIAIKIHFPAGDRKNVTAETGIMLTLHNWGGTDCVGTANPKILANELNVISICVNYLQSGKRDPAVDTEPYDFGYLQALDALRSLWFVFDGLEKSGIHFSKGRLFVTGGSGGGNVSLMANKLAPRTFTCVVDMSGMAELSDDIAFNEPGGSGLNARWSRDQKSANFLSKGAQEIRYIGNPSHLRLMKEWGNAARIVVMHGEGDKTCPFEDVKKMVSNFKKAGLDVRPNLIGENDLDGKVFSNTGHSVGNRTQIVFKVAGDFLKPGGTKSLFRKGPTDFERRDSEVRYPVSGGVFVISYENGFPIGIFDP